MPRGDDRTLDKALVLATCVGALVAIGLVDYLTGYEVRVYPLYLVPISYGAWRLSRTFAMLLAAGSAGSWVVANVAAGGTFSSVYIWAVNAGAHFVAFGVVGFLIAELRRRLAAERDLSRKDSLTSLPNSRAFHEQAEVLFAVARRAGTPLTLAYVDLDNFKAVNDKHGHHEGDRALTQAAEVLKQHSRGSDLVARLGGDEFALLLFEAGPEAARATLERLRDLIASAMREHDWPITASFGALSYVCAPATVQEAVHVADGIMYRAKQGGKNRVHLEVIREEQGKSGSQDRAKL